MNQLPEQVQKNIETIIGLQAQQEQNIPGHHRLVETIATAFGQPWFLYAELVFFTVWSIYSYLANVGLLDWEFPLFNLHEQGIDVAALLISTGVLIYQTRQEKLDNERSHLILQLNLLTEQKIAKLIALVEELRVDLPNVQNRYDLEAEMMQQATDPQVVLDVLQETLKQVSIEVDRQVSEEDQTLTEPNV
ncbi:DUF1003 domain-containing protein [Tumidithrix elongata RA019]|uniref:DUF1003 domain-containing protein n=1 Tax=Tumidithrix elongata BACA0141 TaxID=2716417 RepID=A0AAW9PVE1_9CYAN|nr:DUF1003 domain-containing protein [Tumidithrix elongata RA019]